MVRLVKSQRSKGQLYPAPGLPSGSMAACLGNLLAAAMVDVYAAISALGALLHNAIEQ